jgi:hypothetical protein
MGMKDFVSWSKKSRRGWVTLARAEDTKLFKVGMSLGQVVKGRVVRVKAIDHETGALYLDAPLWWRLQIKLANLLAWLSRSVGQ